MSTQNFLLNKIVAWRFAEKSICDINAQHLFLELSLQKEMKMLKKEVKVVRGLLMSLKKQNKDLE